MKKLILKILLIIIIVLNSKETIAQINCRDSVIYQTITLGNGEESLPFPLTFQFSKDSLIVSPFSSKGKILENFLEFKILNKKCAWTESFVEGESEYELLSTDKQKDKLSKLNIIVREGKGKITLLYAGNNESRVFEMKL
jgi:hypothetical protein